MLNVSIIRRLSYQDANVDSWIGLKKKKKNCSLSKNNNNNTKKIKNCK